MRSSKSWMTYRAGENLRGGEFVCLSKDGTVKKAISREENMSDDQKPLEMNFEVVIKERDYGGKKLHFSVTEQIPTGKNPIQHLRERLREEIDRSLKVNMFRDYEGDITENKTTTNAATPESAPF